MTRVLCETFARLRETGLKARNPLGENDARSSTDLVEQGKIKVASG